mgnify:CR=1 FL=1
MTVLPPQFLLPEASSGGKAAGRRGQQTPLFHRSAAQMARLSGNRLHLHEGPIDLVLHAEGPGAAEAEACAIARFTGLLAEIASELPALRSANSEPLFGSVARAMATATAPFRPAFITPMAAVAGAVADAILAAMLEGGGLSRAYVNNGGDIALHLAPGQSYSIAIAARDGAPDRITLNARDGIRGIATSGWRGRSQSLGIADTVTVLAPNAAMADAAATMIANAVDLPGHPAITRRPACEIKADSDLGQRPVTVAVGALTAPERGAALDLGAETAQVFLSRGLIAGAAIFLHPDLRLVGAVPQEPARA